jgi:hypothetical protein
MCLAKGEDSIMAAMPLKRRKKVVSLQDPFQSVGSQDSSLTRQCSQMMAASWQQAAATVP